MIPRIIQVLLVEESPTDALIVQEVLGQSSGIQFVVTHVERLSEAVERVKARRFSVVLLDLNLPDSDGLGTFARLREAAPEVPVIVLSAGTDEDLAAKTVQAGAQDYIVKGQISTQLLERAIRYAIERKRNVEALRLTQVQLRQLLDYSPAVLYALRVDGKCATSRLVSENITPMLGVKVADAMSPDWWRAHVHPEDRERAERALAATMTHGASHTEYRLRHTDGSYRWVDDHQRLVRDTTGALLEVIGVWTNITERKQAEEVQQRQQSELRVLFDLMPAMIWFKDANGGIIRVNQRAAAAAGKSVAEIEGKSSREIYPQEAEKFYADDLEVISSGAPKLGYVEAMRSPEGGEIWVQTDKVPYFDPDGQVVGVVVMAQDITPRKQAEATLAESEERFSNAFEHASIGMALVALDGRWLKVNRALCNIVGYSAEELLVKSLQDITFPSDLNVDLENLGRLTSGEIVTYKMEKRYCHKAGNIVWVMLNVSLLHDARGQPLTFIAQIQDITGRKQAEDILREKNSLIRIAGLVTRTGGWVLEVPSQQLFWSEEVFDILEFPQGSAPPLAVVLSLYADKWRDKIKAALGACVAHGTAFDLEVEIFTAKKRQIWVRVCGEAELRADGSVMRVQGAFQDISSRKRADKALREGEQRYRSLVEATSAIVWDTPASGEFEQEQPGWTAFTGQSFLELRGWGWLDAIHPDDRTETARVWSTAVANHCVYEVEHRLKARDQTYRDMIGRAVPILSEDGKIIQWIGVHSDITDRKRAEVALRESERFVRAALDGLTAHIAILGETGEILAVNEAWRSFGTNNGISWKRGGRGGNYLRVCENVRGCGVEDAAPVAAAIRETLQGKRTLYEAEYPCHSPTEQRWFMVRVTPFPGEGPRRVVVAHENITRRRLQQEELQTSEERFRQVVENIHEVFWMRDVQNRLIYVSPGYAEISGRGPVKPSEYSAHFAESIHPEDREKLLRTALSRQIAGKYDETYRIVRPDGAIRWVHSKAFPVRNAAGEVYRIAGVAEDITERKEADQRLELHNAVTAVLAGVCSPAEMNRNILEILCRGLSSEMGELWMVDRAAKVLRCVEVWHPPSTEFNEFAAVTRSLTLAGGEGLPGAVWTSGACEWSPNVAQDERSKRRMEAPGAGLRGWIGFPIKIRNEVLGVMGFLGTHVRPPQQEMLSMLDALGAQIGIFVERRQLAEQFRQAQKMEAIGTLAGGIAHDFNNVLAAINGYTELAKLELTENPLVTEHLNAVLSGARRAADLVRQILAFSRQQELQRIPVQLQVVVREAMKLLRATIPSSVVFKITLATNVPNVLADASEIHQIIMNLCTNAAHAMGDGPGQLTVALENFVMGSEMGAPQPVLRNGDYVRLSVSDTGHGMDEATQSRIFEPFFTTKAPGEGTGLGLAVVHGIMQSHEGAITVYSHRGEGTTFHLYFPAYVGEEIEAAVQKSAAPWGNKERILYVDDEILLTTMGKRILERLGYIVDARTSAIEALAAVRADPSAYDLIVTDHMMPGLTGTNLAEQIHAIRPGLPIILTTGYSATLTPERVKAMGVWKLLLKPLSVDELGLAVHEILITSKGK